MQPVLTVFDKTCSLKDDHTALDPQKTYPEDNKGKRHGNLENLWSWIQKALMMTRDLGTAVG